MWNPAQNLQFFSAFMVTRKDPLSWCFSCIIFSLSYIRDAGGIPNPNTKPPAGTTGLSSFFAMPMLSIFLSLFLIERERHIGLCISCKLRSLCILCLHVHVDLRLWYIHVTIYMLEEMNCVWFILYKINPYIPKIVMNGTNTKHHHGKKLKLALKCGHI